MPHFATARQIKVGVIGYGGAYNMGRQHLKQMKQAGMRPTAVAELDPARLEIARTEFPGIETYTDVADMLRQSDVNLVTLITPHNTHAPLALQCLRAGRHVVCEKPFAITTAECDRMIAEAAKRKLMVSTYHNRHWDGCILQALKFIRSRGALGEVFKVECHMGGYRMPGPQWRSSRSMSGGIMYDWGVHLLEYALQVINSDMVEVTGFAKEGYWVSRQPKSYPWLKDANEDEASAIVRFANGCLLNLTISNLAANPKPGVIEFFGTRGSYVMGLKDWTTRVAGRKGIEEKSGDNPKGKGHLFYRNIADYLTGKADLIITPQWARRPIHILDLASRSAKAGKTLKVKHA